MYLNRGQGISVAIVILGVLVASTSQLTDLFGPIATKYIVSASTLCMSIMAGINTMLQGQGSQVEAVRAMPGIEKLLVNDKANATLAAMAIDPALSKIEAIPADLATVTATAQAAA